MTTPTPVQQTELEPCPFCGAAAEVINYSVHCNHPLCNAQPFTSGATVPDAIAAWNRRASPRQEVVEQAKPVAWQARFFHRDPDDTGWGAWRECSEQSAERWRGTAGVEVRALYASPVPAPTVPSVQAAPSEQDKRDAVALDIAKWFVQGDRPDEWKLKEWAEALDGDAINKAHEWRAAMTTPGKD